MSGTIRSFCVLAVFCGAALQITPEGSVRHILQVLVTAVLLIQLLSGIRSLDSDLLGREIGRLRENEQRFRLETQDVQVRMDRLVIEDELRTYIQNKAGQKGLSVTDIQPELHWETEGCWLPTGLTLRGSGSRDAISELFSELEAELGIPRERQRWIEDEGLEE